MQKIKSTIFISPFLSAIIVAAWSGIQTGTSDTPFLVFIMWFVAGNLSLVLFGLPLILLFRKWVLINLPYALLISVMSAELMTLVITVLFPGRHPWYVSFYTFSLINIPCSIIAGFLLWYFGFKSKNA